MDLPMYHHCSQRSRTPTKKSLGFPKHTAANNTLIKAITGQMMQQAVTGPTLPRDLQPPFTFTATCCHVKSSLLLTVKRGGKHTHKFGWTFFLNSDLCDPQQLLEWAEIMIVTSFICAVWSCQRLVKCCGYISNIQRQVSVFLVVVTVAISSDEPFLYWHEQRGKLSKHKGLGCFVFGVGLFQQTLHRLCVSVWSASRMADLVQCSVTRRRDASRYDAQTPSLATTPVTPPPPLPLCAVTRTWLN